MPTIYGTLSEKPRKCELDGGSLQAIARIVRAFAEIEHILQTYIAGMCSLTPGAGIVLLGRSNISRRVEMAEYLSKIVGAEAASDFSLLFDSQFRELLTCRNSVAHGVLLGLDSEGRYSFLTERTDIPDGNTAIGIIMGYEPEYLHDAAGRLERFIPHAEDVLGIEEARKELLDQPLYPHRKAQPRKSSRSKEP